MVEHVGVTFNHNNIVLKIFSPFRIFEQLGLALKNRVYPESFQAWGSAAPRLVRLCLCKHGRPRFSALSSSLSTFTHISDKSVLAKRVYM